MVVGSDLVSVGDRVNVMVQISPMFAGDEKYAEAARPGIEAAIFGYRIGPADGWFASVEGFTVACEGGPLMGWTGSGDTQSQVQLKFASQAEAHALRDRLRAAGFSAIVQPVPTAKGTLNRVRVGPVATRAEAEQLKSRLAAGFGNGNVVQHP